MADDRVDGWLPPLRREARAASSEVTERHRKAPDQTGMCVVCRTHYWPCHAARLAMTVNALLDADEQAEGAEVERLRAAAPASEDDEVTP